MMKTRLMIGTLLMVATGIANAADAPMAAKEGKAEAALKAVDREASKATTNLEATMAFYADDAQFFVPNAPVANGKEAIRKMWTGMIAIPGYALSWQPQVAFVAKSGDLGYTTGTYSFTLSGADGKPVTDKGKYVVVWKKIGGKWKNTADIFNSDTPLPPAPAKQGG